jgi:ubiquitin carboxyl-terminal hydrolase 14
MMSGILDSLNQQIEKHSSSLDRSAVYNEQRRIDRLPAYLTTHFVRFYWRRDINKKTKIMRKVKFPFDLDVTPFLSDQLKAKVLPAKQKIISIEKERDERMKIRRKVKSRKDDAVAQGGSSDAMAVDSSAEASTATASNDAAAATTATPQVGVALSDAEELELREKEKKEADEAIDGDLKNDIGCNPSALYELVGIVTHKGADADAGHYISWVRKDDAPKTEAGEKAKISDKPVEEWYKVREEGGWSALFGTIS